jgi:hypothetical protein
MNRQDRRRAGVANTDAFRSAFVQAELVMRQALAIRIDKAIQAETNPDTIIGYEKARKIVTGEVE